MIPLCAAVRMIWKPQSRAVRPMERTAPFTADGALVDGKAVCAGYARAFVLLCRAAGMDAIDVAGDEGMNHGWNAVRLEGETYFIDCTFDDPVPIRGSTFRMNIFCALQMNLHRPTHGIANFTSALWMQNGTIKLKNAIFFGLRKRNKKYEKSC